MRYANSMRIATNIIENIQRQLYEFIIGRFNISQNSNVALPDNNGKVFGAKVPSGYNASVILSNAGKPDIALNITVKVI